MSLGRSVAWYRFRTTLRRRWGGYLSVVVLIGLTGGTALGSVEAARLTQSSYPTFLASTNPSDMSVSVFAPETGAAVRPLGAEIARLPDVEDVREVVAPGWVPLSAEGAPRLDALSEVTIVASLDGEFLAQDRPALSAGRLPAPGRADEMVMTASAARLLGVHLGQVVPMGLYTAAQEAKPGFGTPMVAPRLRAEVKVAGIIVLNNDVVADDIDRVYGFVVVTAALVKEAVAVSPAAGAPVSYALQLRGGAGDVPAVERRVLRLLPPGASSEFHVTARVSSEVELAVRPESVALAGFGAIAALVCLVLGTQAVARQLRLGDVDRQVLRALGAGPSVTAGDGLFAALASIVLGALVAAGVAVALSPLWPLGPVRPVYPHRGVVLDWVVVGGGLAVLVGVLGAGAVGFAIVRAPHRQAGPGRLAAHPSRLAQRAEAAGVPVAGVVGLRFALEAGRGPAAVPARSALLGAVIAVTMVVATLTFSASLVTLVSHPALYGWDWAYTLDPTNDVPPQAVRLLDHDPDISAWSGFDYNIVEVDGLAVPALFARSSHESVSPPVLSGHGLEGKHQVVMGAATLAVLHKHVGETVSVAYGRPGTSLYVPSTRLLIVGTATFPTVGYASLVADHTSMGTGVMFSEATFPAALRRALQSPDPNLNGPELVFVRLRPDVGPATGRADMQRIAGAADRVFAADPHAQDNNVVVLGPQRPAQIVNYRAIGSTPVLLAIGLATGATGALGLTLAASVRRRRTDLALLKALGLTPGQLATAVACQATMAAAVGVATGVPLGVVLGRQLWALFADNLNAVPDPTVPALSLTLAAVSAFVFANAVAALPGRTAARTPIAPVLRAK